MNRSRFTEPLGYDCNLELGCAHFAAEYAENVASYIKELRHIMEQRLLQNVFLPEHLPEKGATAPKFDAF
jgi:hypothetical protein